MPNTYTFHPVFGEPLTSGTGAVLPTSLSALSAAEFMRYAKDDQLRDYQRAIVDGLFNAKANNLTQERKRFLFRTKLKQQLNGAAGRLWRYERHQHSLAQMKARHWVSGKHTAVRTAMERAGITGDSILQFLLRLPRPEKLDYEMKAAIRTLFGISMRACEGSIDEFASLAYTLRDRQGRIYAYGDRDAHKRHRALGHYVEEKNRMIVTVPKDEWEKWPKSSHAVFTDYKQFKQVEGTLRLPWESEHVVIAPITKKQIERSSLAHTINAYHSTMARGYIELDEAPSSEYTFGCEIEIVPGGDHDRHAAAGEILMEMGSVLDIERDGSVANGFEIVTGFGTFNALDKVARQLYARFLSSRHRVYNATSKTGLHVHVGRRYGIDWKNIVAMAQLEGRFPTLFTQLVGRAANTYCVRLEAQPAPVVRDGGDSNLSRIFNRLRGSRYSSFNVTGWDSSSERRFEWRSPKSTTSYAAWRARLELINFMVKWADDDLMRTSVPTIDDFLKRIMDSPRHETVGLRRTLKTAAVGRTLLALGSTVPVDYNGRREYAALNV